MVQSMTQHNTPYPPVARALFYRGLPSRVARNSGKSLSFVCRVAKGKATSKAVRAALMREVIRVEREIARGKKAA
jgi:hypothetical protein